MFNEWLENKFILYGCGLEAEKFMCRNKGGGYQILRFALMVLGQENFMALK